MSPAAVSGSRLLMSSTAGGVASFNFVNNPGSVAPVNGPTITISDTGEVSTDRLFAWSSNGGIFWATGITVPNPLAGGGPEQPPTVTRAARAYFLTTDANSALGDVKGVDVEVYEIVTPATQVAANALVTRAGAMLNNDTAIFIAAAAEAPATSSAINVLKTGSPPTLDKTKRILLQTPIGSIVFGTTSDGFYYFSTNTTTGAPEAPVTTSTITVVEPGCGAP
jgi:hypothetical protein